MLQIYYPFEYVDSVFSIDYHKLWQMGYRAIIFDIDNTLVHHGKDSTEEVDELFRQIHNIGLKTLLLSNNSEARIQRFCKNIDTLYIHEANKPDTTGYRKALKMLEVEKHQALVIGDQVFTDIRGANRCGMQSVLVKYLRYPDEKKIGIRRNLEKIILKFYKISRFQHRIGDICKEEVTHA